MLTCERHDPLIPARRSARACHPCCSRSRCCLPRRVRALASSFSFWYLGQACWIDHSRASSGPSSVASSPVWASWPWCQNSPKGFCAPMIRSRSCAMALLQFFAWMLLFGCKRNQAADPTDHLKGV
jgi:hypothetical protein